jgi:hypothetical protein
MTLHGNPIHLEIQVVTRYLKSGQSHCGAMPELFQIYFTLRQPRSHTKLKTHKALGNFEIFSALLDHRPSSQTSYPA